MGHGASLALARGLAPSRISSAPRPRFAPAVSSSASTASDGGFKLDRLEAEWAEERRGGGEGGCGGASGGGGAGNR